MERCWKNVKTMGRDRRKKGSPEDGFRNFYLKASEMVSMLLHNMNPFLFSLNEPMRNLIGMNQVVLVAWWQKLFTQWEHVDPSNKDIKGTDISKRIFSHGELKSLGSKINYVTGMKEESLEIFFQSERNADEMDHTIFSRLFGISKRKTSEPNPEVFIIIIIWSLCQQLKNLNPLQGKNVLYSMPCNFFCLWFLWTLFEYVPVVLKYHEGSSWVFPASGHLSSVRWTIWPVRSQFPISILLLF